MAEHRITDFVDQSAIDRLKELNAEMQTVKLTYVDLAKNLIAGLTIKVQGLEGLEALLKNFADTQKRAAENTQQLNTVAQQQQQVMQRTSAQISEALAEQTKLNQETRQSKVSQEEVKKVLENINGTYENHVKNLMRINQQMSDTKKQMTAVKMEFAAGKMSAEEYDKMMLNLTIESRQLSQEKAKLTTLLKNEEREMNTTAGSYNHLSQQLELLKKTYKDLTPEEAQSAAGKRMLKVIQDLDVELKHQAETMGEHQRNVGNYAIALDGMTDSMFSAMGVSGNFGKALQSLAKSANSGNLFSDLTTKVQAFGKTLMGLLANPAVLALLGIGGIAMGVKWWYDYNKGLTEATKLTHDFTGLAGDEMKNLRSEILGVADAFGKDFKEVLNVTDKMASQLGISYDEALTAIKDGFIADADAQGAFLSQIDRFAPSLRDAGLSAREMVAIISQTRSGIFSEDGLQAIQVATDRIKRMPKATADALDAIGMSHQEIQQKLADGTMSLMDVIQQASARIGELPENSKQVGEAVFNLFGRKSAAGGLLLVKSLADVNTNLDEEKKKMGELGDLQEQQMNSQIRLEKTLAAVFDTTGGGFEKMTTMAKTFVNDGIVLIIEGCVDIVNWFIRLYNNSILVRGVIEGMVSSFKTMWAACKFFLSQAVDGFKALATIIEGALTLDVDKIKQGYEKGLAALKDNWTQLASTVKDNLKEAIDDTFNGEPIAEVTLDFKVNEEGGGASAGRGTATGSAETTEEKVKKVKETVKKLSELEIAKINITNRLEAVKQGTAEELALRLQLLELAYKAEMEEAEKTGVDKLAIEEKYAAKRLELYQKHQAEQMKAVEQRYANEATLADIAYQQEVALLTERYAKDLEAAGSNQKKREALEKSHQAKLASIAEAYARQKIQAEIDMLNELLASDMLTAEDREKMQHELARQTIALEKARADAAIEANKKIAEDDKALNESRMANVQKYMQFASNALSAVADLANAIYEGKIQQIEEEKDANDEAAERLDEEQTAEEERIDELVEKQVITEEEGEARKRAAQAQTLQKKKELEKKNEELEKKKQDMQYKQAIWDKANQVAQCGINTAAAIMASAKLGFPAAIPWVAMAATMGALQLATILATPIPKYKRGTERHKGGLAIVGDGGVPEVVSANGEYFITPDKPTLVDIPEGAQVYPNVNEFVDKTMALTATSKQAPIDLSRVEKRLEASTEVLRSIEYLQKGQGRQIAKALYRQSFEQIKEKV